MEEIDDQNILLDFEALNQIQGEMVLSHCEVKFTERTILMDNEIDKNSFDLFREHYLTKYPPNKNLSEEEENLLYANLLLTTLKSIKYRYRKVFIIYQACNQSDPITWVENFMKLMTDNREAIVAFGGKDDTFYETSLGLLNDVKSLYQSHHKKDKLSVSWGGSPTQFVELVLALYKAEHETHNILTYGPDIKDEKALISAMAHKFNFVIKDIYNYIESIKARKEIKGQEDKKARFLHKLIDSLIAYCRDSDSL